MLLPSSSGVAALIAVASGKLHLVCPRGRTLHRKTIANINTDVPVGPNCFANFDVAEIRRNVPALGNHRVSSNVGYAIYRIIRAAIGLGLITAPAPQEPLD